MPFEHRAALKQRLATMNWISALIGIVALVGALVAFIPFLGWLNWLVIPVVAIGLVLGLFSDNTTGRNINLVVLGIAMFRLFIGGGLIYVASCVSIVAPCGCGGLRRTCGWHAKPYPARRGWTLSPASLLRSSQTTPCRAPPDPGGQGTCLEPEHPGGSRKRSSRC
jgi:hypothetical protein